MVFKDQNILVTGGTGSFGKKFVETILREHKPAKVVILSRDELKQHEMRIAGYDDPRLRYFIGDVRDLPRLKRAFKGIDIVVHAAALKQVPACEYNPIEAIATNIDGARNVIDAALDCGVKKVLALSTDKATAPVNLYGATKLVSEKLFVQANSYSGSVGTTFSCVRYGNVVGSRGSVVPLFQEQRKSGKITVTDSRMTRFWITLDQGVRFVLANIERMKGGEVFIPKLPSMRMLDLGKALAPECEVENIGIRPGEKLHECLISEDEARQAVDLGDCYAILPAHPWWSEANHKEATKVTEGWSYASDNNNWWLTNEELMEMINA